MKTTTSFAEVIKHLFAATVRLVLCSTPSIRTSSLKFPGLLIPKICVIFGHDIKRPGDLDL